MNEPFLTKPGNPQFQPVGKPTLDTFGQMGFTLIEALFALAIFSIVVSLLFSSLFSNIQRSQKEFSRQLLTNNGRSTQVRLVQELRRIGLNAYWDNLEANRQPKIIWADPYQIVFSADVDPQRGPMHPNVNYGPQVIGTSTALYDAASTVGQYVVGDPNLYDDGTGCADIDLCQDGAEVIRIGLDWNGDGVLDHNLDLEDNYWSQTTPSSAPGLPMAMPEFATSNPNDYILIREVFGFQDNIDPTIANQGDFEVIGIGIRPSVAIAVNDVPTTWPSGDLPPPLFGYWGYFGKSQSIPDPNDPNGLGTITVAAESLWGDKDDSGTLDPNEILLWVNDQATGTAPIPPAGLTFPYSGSTPYRVQYIETGVLPAGDKNFDKEITTRLDGVLTRIVINLTVESGTPNLQNFNIERSDANNNGVVDSSEVKHPYQDIILSQSVEPINLRLVGMNRN